MTEDLLALNQQEQDRLENESYSDSTATHAGAADWTEEEAAAYQYEAQALWEEYQQEYWTPVTSHHNHPEDPGNLPILLVP